MGAVAAVELKRRGVSALEPTLAVDETATITVRGKDRYVVMKMETYARLREAELEQAVREARADYAAGRVADASIEAHLARIEHAL
jgi:PHD/YefM family antitoxin component YafN of YafNO toxin-antitoxin module